MKKYQWCLSVTALVIAIVIGGIAYIAPLRALAIYSAWKSGSPSPQVQVAVRRLYVPSQGGEVQLQTDHYFPHDSDLSIPQYPTVMIRTPYGIDHHQGALGLIIQLSAYYLATQEYNVILQNCRGRFNSSGEYSPLENERADGHATMAWLKEQPWFNGKLGTAGLSYVGMTQYTLFGKDAPLRINAAVPVLSSPTFYNIANTKDAPVLDVLLNWNFAMASTMKQDPRFPEMFVDFFYYSRDFDPLMYNFSLTVPLIEADQTAFGKKISQYYEMAVNYREEDEYWRKRDAQALLEDIGSDTVHIVGAWYDMFMRDTMNTYKKMVELGKNPYLTIYPGHHGSPETLFFGGVSLPWFNYKLKGDKSLLRAKPVKYIINPTGEWVEADSWPPASTDKSLFLHPGGKIDDAFLPSGTQETYSFTFDPTNPTPILAGSTLNNGGGVDNFEFLTKRVQEHHDILLFFGSPFSKDTVITGYPRVKLWVSSSIPHADFYVRLLDHNPANNVSINVCDGFIRLHEAKSDLFELEIELDPITYKIQQGHTVMLEVAGGAHPHYSRNPGTGVHLTIATEFVKSERQLAVSSDHPSSIILSIVQ